MFCQTIELCNQLRLCEIYYSLIYILFIHYITFFHTLFFNTTTVLLYKADKLSWHGYAAG